MGVLSHGDPHSNIVFYITMNPKHDELWKLPQDTLALASEYDISPVVNDEEIAGMDFLSEESDG